MAEQRETHVWEVRADVGQLGPQIDTLNNSLRQLEERADRAEAELRRLGTTQRRTRGDTDKLAAGFGAAEKIAAGFEGRVAGATGVVVDFSEGLMEASAVLGPTGTAIAGVGLAAAGAAFAVAGLASIFLDMAEGAETALDDLKELGVVVPPELADRVENLNLQIDRLEVAGQRLLVSFAAASDEGADLIDMFADAAETVADLAEHLPPVVEGLQQIRDQALAMVTFGGSEFVPFLLDLTGAFADVENELIGVSSEFQSFITETRTGLVHASGGVEDLAQWYADLEEQEEKTAKASEESNKRNLHALAMRGKALENLTAGYQEQIAHQLELEQIQVDAHAEAADAVTDYADRAVREYERMIEAAEDQAEAITDAQAMVSDLVATETASSIDELARVFETVAERTADMHRGYIEQHQQRIQALRDEKRELREQLKASEELSETERRAAEARIDEIDNQIARRRDMIDAGKEQEKAAIQAAQNMHNLSKAAASSQVIINSAVATLALLSSPGFAFLGPGAVPAVLGVMALVTGTQLAAIAAQPPPTLHDGGLAPDEFMMGGARVMDQESAVVFSRRATELGEAARAVEANRRPGRGGGDPIRAELVMTEGGRQIARLLARETGRPSSSANRVAGATGRRSPYASGER